MLVFFSPHIMSSTEQDKWRNMSVTAYGWGSRERARIALKKSRQISKHDGTPMSISTVVKDIDNEIVDVKPLAMSSEPLQITGQKRTISRLVWLLLHLFMLGILAAYAKF